MTRFRFTFFITILICCCTVMQAQDSRISFRLRGGNTAPFGGFAAASVDVDHCFENSFAISGGVQYNSIGRTAAEIRPAYLFELERHFQPSLMLQGWWYPNEWLGVNMGVSYKPTGMFGIASDYYQLYGSTGLCYRW